MKLKNIRSCIFILAVFALAAGCSNTSSDNVKTSGFYATYSVQGDNSGSVTCTAKFQVGGATGTFLSLDGTDNVTCNGITMNESELFGTITYSITAGIPYTVGGTYTIVLTRAGEAPYSSTAVLPAAITVTSPGPGGNHTKASALTPTWTASGDSTDNMWVSLSVNGTGSSRQVSHLDSAPENGMISFASNETVLEPPQMGTHNSTLSFERYKNGTMASGLSGTISGSQLKSQAINLVD